MQNRVTGNVENPARNNGLTPAPLETFVPNLKYNTKFTAFQPRTLHFPYFLLLAERSITAMPVAKPNRCLPQCVRHTSNL